jgi:uncharacterized protein with GYD domain
MAKYLVKANYVGEGVQGLLSEGGTARRAAVQKGLESLGGTLESMYYAFGDTDAYLIIDMPDNVSATSMSLVTNASGVAKVSVTVLLTPEEVDAATKMTPDYRPPGG